MEKQIDPNKLANRNAATLVACFVLLYYNFKYTYMCSFFSAIKIGNKNNLSDFRYYGLYRLLCNS